MSVPRKYGILRVIAFILKLLAWIVLVIGIAGLVAGLVGLGGGAAWPVWLRSLLLAGTIAAPILGVIWFVQLFAYGSILSLLVDIEENTRLLAGRSAE